MLLIAFFLWISFFRINFENKIKIVKISGFLFVLILLRCSLKDMFKIDKLLIFHYKIVGFKGRKDNILFGWEKGKIIKIIKNYSMIPII